MTNETKTTLADELRDRFCGCRTTPEGTLEGECVPCRAAAALEAAGEHASTLARVLGERETKLQSALVALEAKDAALRDLREACTDAYKAGRIAAEPFVRAGNALALGQDGAA